MKNKYRNLLPVAGLFLIAIGLVAIFSYIGKAVDQTVAEESDSPRVQFAKKSYHLEDNQTLYQNHNPADIETMYLTVSRGNDAENTNHSWKDLNGYSMADYERMNVPRYQIAGLLQVGDQNGPLPGEVGYNDTTPNATVQIRGQSSSRNAQKNYKIEIKENKGDWKGQTTINLNKHQSDSLRFRNKLAFTLLQDIPQLLSLRTKFVHLYVKDTTGDKPDEFVDYGLYTQVEQLNKSGKKAHNLDTNGQLYKVNYFEFIDPDNVIKLATDPGYDQAAFEHMLEIKGSHDHSKLINIMEKVNDTSVDIDDILDKNFDRQNVAYWMAFQILMGNRDTQNRNMYLYSPANTQRWYIIPWDHDGSLFETEYGIDGVVGNAEWEVGVSNYWGNLFFQRALKSKKFRAELDKAVEDLHANYITPDKVKALSTELATIVEPYVNKAPDNAYLAASKSDYQKILDALPLEVENNYRTYKESLEKPMPFFINLPENQGGKLKLNWGTAFDFQTEKVTYTVEVSKDYDFSTTIYKSEDIMLNEATIDMPDEGQYFVRVKATDASGYSQYAFDYYVAEDSKYVGTLSFYVGEDQSISEDTYVED